MNQTSPVPTAVCLLLAALAVGDSLGTRAHADSQPDVDTELRAAIGATTPLAERIAGDDEAFKESVQPFGPLDLIVLRATSGRQASEVRSFFLGAMGRAARVDPGPLANAWHCGSRCAAARRDSLVQALPAIRALVEKFRTLKGVECMAPWPRNGYRAGLLTFDGRTWRLDTPSPAMGFVPWKSAGVRDSGRAEFAAMRVDRAAVEAVIAEMRRLHLAVLARDASGCMRAVLNGAIGDNEAGLLFLPAGAAPPSFDGVELLDGRKYVGGVAVAPGVYFYVTT